MLVERWNRPWSASLLVIGSLLWRCTVVPIEPKGHPSGVPDFTLEENYETVFRRITQQAKQCYQSSDRHIEATLFREKEMAEVTVAIVHLGTSHILLTAEIKAISPKNTQITTHHSYSPPGAWRDSAYTIQRWAASEEPYCPNG